MAISQEEAFAGLTCLLLLFPLVVLLRGYRRSRNPRMLLAFFAVLAFFATDAFILLSRPLGWAPSGERTELVEFVGDIVTALLLAVTFGLRFGGEA